MTFYSRHHNSDSHQEHRAEVPFHLDLPEAPPELRALARELFEETRSPQSDAWNEPRRTPEDAAARQSVIFALQNLLQDPNRCRLIAADAGVDLAAFSLAPRKGTPTGDFFDVIRIPDGRLSLLLGDAVGHDSQEAWDNSVRFNLFTSSSRFLERAYADFPTASRVLCYLDTHCNFRGGTARDSVVVAHVLFDPESGWFGYANAGNPHYLSVLSRNGGVERHRAEGGWLGHPELFQYSDVARTSVDARLREGEIAVLMSDGIPDGTHVSGAPMLDVLPKVLERAAGKVRTSQEAVDFVLSELKSTPDDLSILAFRLDR